MIFVYTSVWISYFRGRDRRLVAEFVRLLESDQVVIAAPVRAEVFSGAAKRELFLLKRVFSALPLFYPTESHWKLTEEWALLAAAKGERFGVLDLLIGALARDHGSRIWSLYGDFVRLEKLKLVSLYRA